MPQYMLNWGIQLILTLQTWGDGLIIPMIFFSQLGSLETYLIIVSFIYWGYNPHLATRIAMAFMVSGIISNTFKLLFHAPRPYWVNDHVRLLGPAEQSFGLPSGHAQNAVVVWSVIATYWRKPWLWAVAFGLMGVIGFSRIYLGVHFPTDVIVGWGLGLLTFGLFIRLEEPLQAYFNRLSWLRKIILLSSLSLGVIILSELIIINTSWRIPLSWTQRLQETLPNHPFNPYSLSSLVMGAGLFLGFMSGHISSTYSPTGTWSQRGYGILLGLIGLLLLWVGLGAMIKSIAPDETLLRLGLDYGRAIIIGLWVSALAPRLFQKIGLSSR